MASKDEAVWSVKNGDLEQVKQHVVSASAGRARRARRAAVELAPNVDAELDAAGRRAIHIASDYGQTHIVHYLLSVGADANATDRHGITPLLAAIWEGHTDTVKLLLEHLNMADEACVDLADTSVDVPQVAGSSEECEWSGRGWLPGARALAALSQPPAPPDKRLCYTMPGLMQEAPLGDPLMDALRSQQPESSFSRGDLGGGAQPKLEMLHSLVSRGHCRAAADLCGALLTQAGQGFGKAHTPSRLTEQSLKIWTLRLQLLVGLRCFTLGQAEMDTFGDLDAPDLFRQYYPEIFSDGSRGSLVPFSLRLLHAEMPRLVGNGSEALHRCCQLQQSVAKIVANLEQGYDCEGLGRPSGVTVASALRQWTARRRATDLALARIFLSLQDFGAAQRLLDATAAGGGDERLHSAAGRLSLQCGALSTANHCFQLFNSCCDQSAASMKALACNHNAFQSVFNGNYADALKSFRIAERYEPDDATAVNNMAVCLVYEGKVTEAVDMLESVALKEPPGRMTEAVSTNLATLYELASSKSGAQKLSLLNSVVRSKGDCFSIGALKLSN